MKAKTKRRRKASPPLISAAGDDETLLQFTPTAWAKLLYLRDCGDTEVGGFGVAAADDVLLVEDVQLVRQRCTWASVTFDDDSVADFFDRQVDEGLRPDQFARIWVHTHPGDCPRPSMTDESTFDTVFGRCDWAVMFILACSGQCYARLRFNVGPGFEAEVPVAIDYRRPFSGSAVERWQEEYAANVQVLPDFAPNGCTRPAPAPFDDGPDAEWYESWFDYADDEDPSEGAR